MTRSKTTGQGPSDAINEKADPAPTSAFPGEPTLSRSPEGVLVEGAGVVSMGNLQAAGVAIASGPTPIGEPHTPSREEAREMFRANSGLWAVLTDEGNITRDQC